MEKIKRNLRNQTLPQNIHLITVRVSSVKWCLKNYFVQIKTTRGNMPCSRKPCVECRRCNILADMTHGKKENEKLFVTV